MTSSTRRNSSSIVPNCAISFIAVFSPIPFTPGILSRRIAHQTHDLHDARRFDAESFAAFGFAKPFVFHRIVDPHMCGVNSWNMSLSPVTMTTS